MACGHPEIMLCHVRGMDALDGHKRSSEIFAGAFPPGIIWTGATPPRGCCADVNCATPPRPHRAAKRGGRSLLLPGLLVRARLLQEDGDNSKGLNKIAERKRVTLAAPRVEHTPPCVFHILGLLRTRPRRWNTARERSATLPSMGLSVLFAARGSTMSTGSTRDRAHATPQALHNPTSVSAVIRTESQVRPRSMRMRF